MDIITTKLYRTLPDNEFGKFAESNRIFHKIRKGEGLYGLD